MVSPFAQASGDVPEHEGSERFAFGKRDRAPRTFARALRRLSTRKD